MSVPSGWKKDDAARDDGLRGAPDAARADPGQAQGLPRFFSQLQKIEHPAVVKIKEELAFAEEYTKLHGRPWRAHYPPLPPAHFMWPAARVGDVHQVVSKHGPAGLDPYTLDLEVISTAPKIFLIKDFLSEAEADHFVALAEHKGKIDVRGKGFAQNGNCLRRLESRSRRSIGEP